MTNRITERILTQLGDIEFVEKLLSLPKSDLNSLLLSLYQQQARGITPAELLKSNRSNRFTAPSQLDPATYHAFEAELLKLAEGLDIKPVLLSPVAPFASSAAFGCVDQNNVISAGRGTEVLPDPTNMLAIIIAERLKSRAIADESPVHLATTARVVRAQVFPQSPYYFAHFGIFCIVSSGRDIGSYQCEQELLTRQLTYYRKLLLEKYEADLSLLIMKRDGYPDGDGFFASMIDLICKQLSDIPVTIDEKPGSNNYYNGVHFKMFMTRGDEQLEIGDGGFVNWIQQLTGNKKERCLITGIGIDRLLL